MKNTKLKILIRFDDICPTMNWCEFNKAIEIFNTCEKKPLLGVIPDCMDPELYIDENRNDFWEWIRQLQNEGYTIAMHGYQHVFDSEKKGLICLRKMSEFSGHSYKVQYEKIKKGKEILLEHGIETDIFFAPGHSYDYNTLRALSDNGFKYMSDGFSFRPYKIFGIKVLPCRSFGVPRKIKNTANTMVFHAHEWIRDDKKDDYSKFKYIYEKYRDNIVDFREYSNQKKCVLLIGIIDEKIYFCAKYLIRYIKKLMRR